MVTKTSLKKKWSYMYGENFSSEYSGIYKKLPKTFTRKRLTEEWDKFYGEDLKKEYAGIYQLLGKNKLKTKVKEKTVRCPRCHKTQPVSMGSCDFCLEERMAEEDQEKERNRDRYGDD